MTNITPNQIKKTKKVGELDGQPVIEGETKGGLFFLMTKTASGSTKTLGTGSHPAVAAHIAERDFPKLKLTELSKSESLDPYTLRKEVERFDPYTKFVRYVTDTE